MKSNNEILAIAKRTLKTESEAIGHLTNLLNSQFTNLVNQIYSLNGRVVITGVGKSAIVGQKIVATLNSTGTPALFMHAGEAIHGDLGMIQADDLIICLSKSGNTAEIKVLIPLLKRGKNKIACFVGDVNSYLAKQSDFVIDTFVASEACPHNLAPTTSTTAQMAMGDALAICLVECRAFSGVDFAKYHPGGTLGKKMYLKVSDLVIFNQKPVVNSTCKIHDVILEISKKRLGIVAVINDNKLIGVITDGDLRRMMQKYTSFENLLASDIMGKYPKTIENNELAVTALQLMQKNQITQLIVMENDNFEGVIHLHDLLKEGIF
ncbi:MAG: KpsF/GutQ family sugar-phosphate isomerase [Sphingobacteriales bacterium]|nr:MAG: KpsF/GutQ family sugar-phosphate isomerase [Sphingobacteriales bacterium]TAF83884.1 MAG: KpsF/GutQ family sugar-phosphate isomerase [Sphingobacteriales bacterium]